MSTYRGYTPAQGKASKKYMAENVDKFTVQMPKGTKDAWKAAAVDAGVSLNKYVIQAVNRRMATEGHTTGVDTQDQRDCAATTREDA